MFLFFVGDILAKGKHSKRSSHPKNVDIMYMFLPSVPLRGRAGRGNVYDSHMRP
jgi:hypothetical protein